MARPSLPTFDLNPAYHYIVTKDDETPLGQLQSISPSMQVQSTKIGRVGTSTKKTLRQSKEGTLAINVFADDDLSELAFYLGYTTPPAIGATISFPNLSNDPVDLLIIGYDSEDGAATEIHRHTLAQFTPLSVSHQISSEGEPVFAISGDLENWELTRSA